MTICLSEKQQATIFGTPLISFIESFKVSGADPFMMPQTHQLVMIYGPNSQGLYFAQYTLCLIIK